MFCLHKTLPKSFKTDWGPAPRLNSLAFFLPIRQYLGSLVGPIKLEEWLEYAHRLFYVSIICDLHWNACENIHCRSTSTNLHCRLYLMSYFPSGFWPRLITRLLGDNTINAMAVQLYPLLDKHTQDGIDETAEWKCWQVSILYIIVHVHVKAPVLITFKK